jgi:hypothetical protein
MHKNNYHKKNFMSKAKIPASGHEVNDKQTQLFCDFGIEIF